MKTTKTQKLIKSTYKLNLLPLSRGVLARRGHQSRSNLARRGPLSRATLTLLTMHKSISSILLKICCPWIKVPWVNPLLLHQATHRYLLSLALLLWCNLHIIPQKSSVSMFSGARITIWYLELDPITMLGGWATDSNPVLLSSPFTSLAGCFFITRIASLIVYPSYLKLMWWLFLTSVTNLSLISRILMNGGRYSPHLQIQLVKVKVG